MSVLVTMALISFTAQAILEVEVTETQAVPVNDDIEQELERQTQEHGEIAGLLVKTANWVMSG